MAKIKGGYSHLKKASLKVGLPTSKDLLKKNSPSQVYPGT